MEKALEKVRQLAQSKDDLPARAVLACAMSGFGIQSRINRLTDIARGKPARKLPALSVNEIKAAYTKEIGEDIHPEEPLFSVLVASQIVYLGNLQNEIVNLLKERDEAIRGRKKFGWIAIVAAISCAIIGFAVGAYFF